MGRVDVKKGRPDRCRSAIDDRCASGVRLGRQAGSVRPGGTTVVIFCTDVPPGGLVNLHAACGAMMRHARRESNATCDVLACDRSQVTAHRTIGG